MAGASYCHVHRCGDSKANTGNGLFNEFGLGQFHFPASYFQLVIHSVGDIRYCDWRFEIASIDPMLLLANWQYSSVRKTASQLARARVMGMGMGRGRFCSRLVGSVG